MASRLTAIDAEADCLGAQLTALQEEAAGLRTKHGWSETVGLDTPAVGDVDSYDDTQQLDLASQEDVDDHQDMGGPEVAAPGPAAADAAVDDEALQTARVKWVELQGQLEQVLLLFSSRPCDDELTAHAGRGRGGL